jgi:hypothetical protein
LSGFGAQLMIQGAQCVRRFASEAPRLGATIIVVYGGHRRSRIDRTVAVSADLSTTTLERHSCAAFFASDGGPHGQNREHGW